MRAAPARHVRLRPVGPPAPPAVPGARPPGSETAVLRRGAGWHPAVRLRTQSPARASGHAARARSAGSGRVFRLRLRARAAQHLPARAQAATRAYPVDSRRPAAARAASVLGHSIHAESTRQRGTGGRRTAGAPARSGAHPHGGRSATRGIPVRRRRFQRRRGADGRGERHTRQHLLHLVRRPRVQRGALRRPGGAPLRHGAPRAPGRARRLRTDRPAGQSVRRTVRRQFRHAHVPRVPAGAPVRHGGPVGRRRR